MFDRKWVMQKSKVKIKIQNQEKDLKNPRGFTLVELLVVIAIIGILATAVIVSVSSARAKARDARRLSDLDNIRTALELYYDQYNRYPYFSPSAVEVSQYFPTNSGMKVYLPVAPKDPRDGQKMKDQLVDTTRVFRYYYRSINPAVPGGGSDADGLGFIVWAGTEKPQSNTGVTWDWAERTYCGDASVDGKCYYFAVAGGK